MNVGIIGAGNVGTALTTAFAKAGHNIVISSDDPEDARRLAREYNAKAVADNAETVSESDIVVLAIPFDAVDAVVQHVGDRFNGKIVVDVTNRIDPNSPASVIDGTSNAEMLQEELPQSSVVKAFNTVLAANQSEPEQAGTVLDGYVAADDPEAKKRVLELVESVGLHPVDVGGLSMARALEAMATLNINLNMQNKWDWQTGWKLVGSG